jgi:hypothetical protein
MDWGYTPRPAIGYNNANGAQPYQYIQAIRIYSLYQQQFDEYELINPIITSFKHGEHNTADNGLMQHEMQIQFETVKYLTGSVTRNTVGGFIDLHYDNTSSPNAVDIGQKAPGTNSNITTDLANNATAINPLLRSNQALQSTALNASSSVSYALSGATAGASRSSINNGGFSIPSLGSLTQGVTNSAMIGQQLQAVGVGLVGSFASKLTAGLTGQLAAGLGPNGGAVIGLAAAAIQNPSATLKTIENMATSYAMGFAVNLLNEKLLNPALGSILGENGLGGGLRTLGEGISTAIGDVTRDLSNTFNGVNAQNLGLQDATGGMGYDAWAAANPDLVSSTVVSADSLIV